MRTFEGGKLEIPNEGKFAIVFHIPGHCAGCKRAIDQLQKRTCEGWDILLVDAESDDNKSLVEEYGAKTAPTVITYIDGKQKDTLVGLKNFLEKADIFGELQH